MIIAGNVELTADIRIDIHEARILRLLCSYDLLAWFREHCNKTEDGWTPEEAKETLYDISQVMQEFIDIEAKAQALLTPKRGRK